MSEQFLSRARFRRGLPALLIAGALTLGACGTSSDESSTDPDKSATTAAKNTDEKTKDDPDGGTDEAGTGTINALVPIDAEAPDGHRMIRAECQATEAEKEPDGDGLSERFQPIVFAVPEAWEARGGGSAGSGGVLGTSYDMNFENESRGKISVDYDWDSRDYDGTILDSGGEPWKSFDYDSQIGDDKTHIKFDLVSTVDVGDQKVELFYLDPTQAPDHVKGEEYRARVSILEVSKSKQQPSELREQSAVLKIKFKSDADFTQDNVVDVVTSVNMPTCTWEEIVDDQEFFLQLDLDGDGKFATAEEKQAELQEKLAEATKDLEKERSGSAD